MKIAIASGKGGTGKTTFSVALCLALSDPVTLLDCDVEEPNCHLFLKGERRDVKNVKLMIPKIDAEKCVGCGRCADFCQFNAVISVKDSAALVFDEMCHACGGCSFICPERAIKEIPFKIGTLTEENIGADKRLITGRLEIGYAMASPVIKDVLHQVEEDSENLVIVDSPPGTSCSFVTTAKGCDFVIFVTEPTPFGLNDLKIALETVRDLGVPHAVVVNRCESKENMITEYCQKENLEILLQIENSRKVAEFCSRGETLLAALPEIKREISGVINSVKKIVGA